MAAASTFWRGCWRALFRAGGAGAVLGGAASAARLSPASADAPSPGVRDEPARPARPFDDPELTAALAEREARQAHLLRFIRAIEPRVRAAVAAGDESALLELRSELASKQVRGRAGSARARLPAVLGAARQSPRSALAVLRSELPPRSLVNSESAIAAPPPTLPRLARAPAARSRPAARPAAPRPLAPSAWQETILFGGLPAERQRYLQTFGCAAWTEEALQVRPARPPGRPAPRAPTVALTPPALQPRAGQLSGVGAPARSQPRPQLPPPNPNRRRCARRTRRSSRWARARATGSARSRST